MIVKVKISDPALVSGQDFRVRYRLLTSVSWTLAGYYDNDEFTLDLPPGEYELEATLRIDDVVSDCSSYYKFIVEDLGDPEDPEECGCPFNASVSMVQRTFNTYAIQVSYQLPASEPECGIEIKYRVLGTTAWISVYAATGANTILITAQNQDYEVEVNVNCCSGEYKKCATFTVPKYTDVPTSECTCLPDIYADLGELEGKGVFVGYTNPPAQNKCGYFVIIETDTGNSITNFYASMPTDSVFVTIDYDKCAQIKVQALCCDGTVIDCYNSHICHGSMVGPTLPECDPISIAPIYENNVSQPVLIGEDYYVKIYLESQSDPVSNTLFVSYVQQNISPSWPGNPNPGNPDSGSINLLPLDLVSDDEYYGTYPKILWLKVMPNIDGILPGEDIEYRVSVIDVCGNAHILKSPE